MAKATTETKKCKKCMEEINKKAKRCPKCGANLGMPGWLKFLIIIGIVFFMCISCMSSCANTVSDAFEEAENEYKDINGKTSFKSGEYFQNKYIKITLDSVNTNFKKYSEYSKPAKGYKVVQFVFTAENIGEDDQYFDYTDFNCYADDEAMQQFYGTDDSGLDSGGTISSGKRVTVPLYCEVPISATSVTAEYDASWLDSINIEFIAQ